MRMLIERRISFLGRHLRLRDTKKEAKRPLHPPIKIRKLSSSSKNVDIMNFWKKQKFQILMKELGRKWSGKLQRRGNLNYKSLLLLSRNIARVFPAIVLVYYGREIFERSSYISGELMSQNGVCTDFKEVERV